MGGRARRAFGAVVLAAAVLCAGCALLGKSARPVTFSSPVAFEVYIESGAAGEPDTLVGCTPSERRLVIPPGERWYVVPRRPVDMAAVRREVEAHGIPGLKLPEATDADLEHLKDLTALRELDLSNTRLADEGLKALRGLVVSRPQVPAGKQDQLMKEFGGQAAEVFEEMWDNAQVGISEQGAAQLEKALPNANVLRLPLDFGAMGL